MCAGTRPYEMLQTAVSLSCLKASIRPSSSLMCLSDEKIIFGSTRKIAESHGLEIHVVS